LHPAGLVLLGRVKRFPYCDVRVAVITPLLRRSIFGLALHIHPRTTPVA
jgi:hypothetical protein